AGQREGIDRLGIVDDLELPREVAAAGGRRDPRADARDQRVGAGIGGDLRLRQDLLVRLGAHLSFLRGRYELELGSTRYGHRLACVGGDETRGDEREDPARTTAHGGIVAKPTCRFGAARARSPVVGRVASQGKSRPVDGEEKRGAVAVQPPRFLIAASVCIGTAALPAPASMKIWTDATAAGS